MDSRLPASFAFALTWRTLLAGVFATLLLQVLTTTHYYATALVLGALIALTITDATRLYARQGVLGVGTRAAEREQARQLDRMAALLDAVTVSLMALAPDGRISFANRAARLLAGEEVGRLADIKALGKTAADTLLALPVGARQIVTMADGRPMLAWLGAFTAPGTPPQRLISLQAVTGELDAVQLKAWADMTRVLAHEMMNSLTPISSLSESLPQLLASGGDVGAAVETIARRSRHLMNFVERYRKIADLPAPSPRRIDLAAFLADIDALMRAHLATRGIGWHCNGIEATLQADPDLLNQALINLLHNAADAAAQNPAPAISLGCTLDNGEVLFRIHDNGPGIPPGRMEEIFVPFFTTKQGGSGIGLTLARQIALAHGGRLKVPINNPGAGATFILALPMHVTA